MNGRGKCRICWQVGEDHRATHLPFNGLASTGDWGIPTQKDGMINLFLEKQNLGVREETILASEVVPRPELQDMPVEMLRSRLKCLRLQLHHGSDPFSLKRGVPRVKAGLIDVISEHQEATVDGEVQSREDLQSCTVATLQEMLFDHWDNQTAIAQVNFDAGRVLR